VKPLLKDGWTPLVGAMLITSFSGLVLDQFVNRYEGYGLLAIVITGLPGGVGSIFVSRISTLLHAYSGTMPGSIHKSASITNAGLEERTPLHPHYEPDLEPPQVVFDSEDRSSLDISPLPLAPRGASASLSTHTRSHESSDNYDSEPEDPRLFLFAGTLFTITFPVQILFLLFLYISGWVELKWMFVVVFMVMFSLAVLASLSLARWLTQYLWSKGLDPDMYAMPIQSSLVDLMGQCLLVLSYELATLMGSDMLTRGPR